MCTSNASYCLPSCALPFISSSFHSLGAREERTIPISRSGLEACQCFINEIYGWRHTNNLQILQIWIHLFVNSLAPPFSSTDLPTLSIPPIPLQTPSQVIDRATKASEAGFFSAFTSYISSYAADDPPEPSDEELESTLCTIDCIKSCNLEKVLDNIA